MSCRTKCSTGDVGRELSLHVPEGQWVPCLCLRQFHHAWGSLKMFVLHRSLVASTLRAAGVEVRFNLRKEFTFKSSMGTYIDDLLHESRRGA